MSGAGFVGPVRVDRDQAVWESVDVSLSVQVAGGLVSVIPVGEVGMVLSDEDVTQVVAWLESAREWRREYASRPAVGYRALIDHAEAQGLPMPRSLTASRRGGVEGLVFADLPALGRWASSVEATAVEVTSVTSDGRRVHLEIRGRLPGGIAVEIRSMASIDAVQAVMPVPGKVDGAVFTAAVLEVVGAGGDAA